MLEKCGGWDAHNVTEDADLSFRIAAHNGHIGYIDLPTREEAVSQFKPWNLQRSRWLKGFMQCWAVHMRTPFAPKNWQGIKRLLTLQLTLGFTLLSSLFYVPTFLIFIGWAIMGLLTGQTPAIAAHFIIAGVFAIISGILIGVIGYKRARYQSFGLSALFIPAYWLLLFWPALRALYELKNTPFFWHKTQHGVSPHPSDNHTDLNHPRYDPYSRSNL